MEDLRQVFKDIADAMRIKGAKGEFIPVDMADAILQIKTDRYITFIAEEDTTLTMTRNGNIEWIKLLKSTDGVNWTKWENPDTNGIVLNAGQSVHIKADEGAPTRSASSDDNYQSFSSTGKIKCNGDIRSIVDVSEPGNYGYWISRIFSGCSNLTSAPDIPVMNVANSGMRGMFSGCSSLTTPPELPATNLGGGCYNAMFSGCSSLTTPPVLPATTLPNDAYDNMFSGCKALTSAPELPAKSLTEYCYNYMFNGCSSLTTPPELPATKLANYCYNGMFNYCTSLTTSPSVLPATTLAPYCYYHMFQTCTSMTSAPELPAMTMT